MNKKRKGNKQFIKNLKDEYSMIQLSIDLNYLYKKITYNKLN